MKDRLGTASWINAPVRNPTQSLFRRFVKMPGSETTDKLKEYRDKFDEFGKKALRTHLSEYLED
jgi:hypothetical protein